MSETNYNKLFLDTVEKALIPANLENVTLKDVSAYPFGAVQVPNSETSVWNLEQVADWQEVTGTVEEAVIALAYKYAGVYNYILGKWGDCSKVIAADWRGNIVKFNTVEGKQYVYFLAKMGATNLPGGK